MGVRAEAERPAALGLTSAEAAFYDAVVQNESAVLELGVGPPRASPRSSWPPPARARPWTGAAARRCARSSGCGSRPSSSAASTRRTSESATELVLEQARLFTEEMLAA